MKVGFARNMLTKEGRSDASVIGEHLSLGDLAEPLGFDSLFALEHHFTGYAMSPTPTTANRTGAAMAPPNAVAGWSWPDR